MHWLKLPISALLLLYFIHILQTIHGGAEYTFESVILVATLSVLQLCKHSSVLAGRPGVIVLPLAHQTTFNSTYLHFSGFF